MFDPKFRIYDEIVEDNIEEDLTKKFHDLK
jgi:hypothetical protein